jgi:hypothetical protein
LRQLLIRSKESGPTKRQVKTLTKEELEAPRATRSAKSAVTGKKGKRKRYDVDGDDDEYFERLERGDERENEEPEPDAQDIGREWAYKSSGTSNSPQYNLSVLK